jgi:hypothetical protein
MEGGDEIAYCFLTYNHIVRKDVWEKYFQYQTGYKVYIHAKERIEPHHYSFPVHIIEDPYPTKGKTDIGIVRATIHLLKRAYDLSPNATHFLFLTQSCIPLYTFQLHKEFFLRSKKSIISVIQHNKVERYHSLSFMLKRYIRPNQFVKQQPNMLLTREDVKWLIENDYTDFFQQMECPDEHYFVNLFLSIYKKEFIHQQINFCNLHTNRTQAENFYQVNKELIYRARGFGAMFLRKVTKISNIDIDFIGIKENNKNIE